MDRQHHQTNPEKEEMELSKKIKELLGDTPEVSLERFIEELWKLRAVGNVEDSYINAVYAIRMNKDIYGNPVTFEILVTKYKEYLQQCDREERESRWIKGIKKWIIDSGYNETYEGFDTRLRDRYL